MQSFINKKKNNLLNGLGDKPETYLVEKNTSVRIIYSLLYFIN